MNLALWRNQIQTFKVLLRHFFSQFFVSESIPLGADGYKTTIQLLAILTAPGLIIPLLWLLPIYSNLQEFPVEIQLTVVRYHQFFFITLSMVISCAVALLEWDRLFLMQRDRSILLILPVSGRTLYSAKLLALLIFAGTFTLAVNFFSMLLFPGVVFVRGTILEGASRFILGHAAGVFAGSVFVFFLVVVIQGLLLAVGRGRPRRILASVQVGISVLLMVVLFLYNTIFETWQIVTSELSLGQILFPPFWFLGLAQTVAGASEEVLFTLCSIACWGLGGVIVGVCFLQLSGQRWFGASKESAADSLLSSDRNWAQFYPIPQWLKDPAALATVFFVMKTMSRSPRHRLIMTGFLGAGLGVSLATFWSGTSSPVSAGASQSFLAIPQILTFFLIVGMRVAFADPAEPGANWLFRLTLHFPESTYLAGVRKLMIAVAMIPLLMLLPVYIYFWGWSIGLLQFGFSLLLAAVVIEVVLFKFHRIPFTSTYLPGSSNLKLWWAFYIFCFSTYAFSSSILEQWLLVEPFRALVFEGLVASLLLLWIWYRRTRIDPHVSLTFEPEDPDQLLALSLK